MKQLDIKAEKEMKELRAKARKELEWRPRQNFRQADQI